MRRADKIKGVNARNFFMSIMIIAGFYSCEKAEIEEVKKARIVVEEVHNDRGGDDEEEPIIQGWVKDEDDQTPISGANVKIFHINQSNPTASRITDINGEFQMTVPTGTYYFKVTHAGSTTQTNNITVNGDMNVTIYI
jgi:hypothetical protein